MRERVDAMRTSQATSADVVVWVSDDLGYATGLRQHLPMTWTTRTLPDLNGTHANPGPSGPGPSGPGPIPSSVDDVGLLVLATTTAGAVAEARRQLPADAHIVAVIDPVAPVDTLVAVLQAGADSCVRGGSSQILAGHVQACQRRRSGLRSAGH